MSKPLIKEGSSVLVSWAVFVASFSVLFFPTFVQLWQTVWQTDSQGQGPLVLLIVLFLFWTKRHEIFDRSSSGLDTLIGFFIVFIAISLFLLGSFLEVLFLEVSSQLFFVIAAVLIISGRSALLKLWFPIFFMIFMVPLPGFIVDGLTLPMKIAVSNVAEYILYNMGYPIARDGVILQIGFYKLLVADACAGLHTLISLEAIGLLYLYLIQSKSVFRNISLAILVVPIAFLANVIRVLTLVLVTFYYGDEVGQGFIHEFSGFVLFMAALVLIIATDVFLRFVARKIKNKGS